MNAGHKSPFNSRKAIEDVFSTLARRFAGRESITLVEFASGNMYGPVPALASLAELGIRKVYLHLIDKDYVEWLKKAGEKPAATESPEGGADYIGVPEYDWGTNCIHGVQSRCGTKCLR